jgi:hypothetical protein
LEEPGNAEAAQVLGIKKSAGRYIRAPKRLKDECQDTPRAIEDI